MFLFVPAPALVLGFALAAQPSSLLGVHTFQPDGAPRVLVHRQATPLLAARLSTPVPTDLPDGAVELIQELARPGAALLAARYGASLELRIDNGHAVILVSGSAMALDGLIGILRAALAEPDLSAAHLLRARSRAESRVLARLEQPGPGVRRRLRHALDGGPEPTGAGGARLEPEAIRTARARLYYVAASTLVLVGDVSEDAVRAALTDWPAAARPDRPREPVTPPDTEPARTQLHHEWSAIGYALDAEPAVLAVSRRLVADRIAASPLRFGTAEAWYGPGGPALVVIGAAVPGDPAVVTVAGITDVPVRDDAAAAALPVTRYLRRLIAEAAALSGEPAVRNAATALRREILLEARTPAGKAEVIGRFVDRDGEPDSAGRFLDRLDSVTLTEVRATLTAALGAPATLVELRP